MSWVRAPQKAIFYCFLLKIRIYAHLFVQFSKRGSKDIRDITSVYNNVTRRIRVDKLSKTSVIIYSASKDGRIQAGQIAKEQS